jgi:hypothetical protein
LIGQADTAPPSVVVSFGFDDEEPMKSVSTFVFPALFLLGYGALLWLITTNQREE